MSMRRLWAVLGSLVFFAIAPGTVAGLIPWLITRWHFSPPFLDLDFTRWVGIVLIVAGLLPLVSGFAHFAWEGFGTPAPIAPPERLVVTGFYRRVRNPMYVGLVVILAGEALIFANRQVFVWGLLFWAGVHLFVVFYEEPTLARQFGDQYRAYRANVPRWLPRAQAWSDAN